MVDNGRNYVILDIPNRSDPSLAFVHRRLGGIRRLVHHAVHIIYNLINVPMGNTKLDND